MSGLVPDLFAGPGGWSVAARELGIRDLGIELDAAACKTREAAGHETLQADVAAFDPATLGDAWGLIGSPPCTTFSAAGDQAGNAVVDHLATLIHDLFAGRDTRQEHIAAMVTALTDSEWANDLEPAKRAGKIRKAASSAALVGEPARFIAALNPEWVALEQVPSVLPLWEVYADELRDLGYSVWTGKLNAADYGVPQTRERAILIASRTRRMARPEPTHYDARKGMQLWGAEWVSMAEALGWGANGRPSVAVTAGGTSTGGAEPFGHRGREALEAERDAGQWVLRAGNQPNAAIRPAPAMAFGHNAARMEWVFRNNNNANACERSMEEPAGTLFFRQRSNWSGWVLRRQVGKALAEGRRDHPLDGPAPTITGGGSAAGSGNGAGLAWVNERPSTTVQGDPRIGRPGHKDRDKGESQFAQDSVRITVQEAAVLQSFPADYPWQGTKTAQFRQVGDAMPPLLAQHVLSTATGIAIRERSVAA